MFAVLTIDLTRPGAPAAAQAQADEILVAVGLRLNSLTAAQAATPRAASRRR